MRALGHVVEGVAAAELLGLLLGIVAVLVVALIRALVLGWLAGFDFGFGRLRRGLVGRCSGLDGLEGQRRSVLGGILARRFGDGRGEELAKGGRALIDHGGFRAVGLDALLAVLCCRLDLGRDGLVGSRLLGTVVAIAAAATLYSWRVNSRGIHESSDKALKIMGATTVMAVVMIVWCAATLVAHPEKAHLPSPVPDLSRADQPGSPKVDLGYEVQSGYVNWPLSQAKFV